MAHRTPPSERTVSPATFRRITLAVLVTQVLIVLTGAAVRLTGSGLGCSNWPNCTEDRLVAPAEYHALIEFVNRLVSFPVVVAVLVALWAAGRRLPPRPELRDLSILLLAGVAAQVFVGAVVVWLDLLPSTVIVHFLISMGLLLAAIVLHHRAGQDLPPSPAQVDAAERSWTRGARSARLVSVLAAWASVVLVSGTIVTGSGPHGGDDHAERLPFFLPTVARIHAVAVWVFLALLVVVLLRLRADRAPRPLLTTGSVLLAVSVAQGAIGYLQYWNGVPAGLVFAHIAGAMAVWCTTAWLWLEHRAAGAAGAGLSWPEETVGTGGSR